MEKSIADWRIILSLCDFREENMYRRYLMKDVGLTDIRPRVCGLRISTPGLVIGPYIRDHYIFHYVLAGKGTYLYNDQRFSLQAGEIFVVHPGARTVYLADEQEPWEYVCAAFDCTEAFASVIPEPVIRAPWAASLFQRMVSSETDGAREWMVCALLHEFFACLRMRHQMPIGPEDYVSRALTDIHSNYAQPLQIADIAASLGLNRSYFCRLFQQHTGISPQAYLVQYRLEKAAEFLTVHHFSQKETAALVGYSDVAAFSKMFKRKYGMAPGAYARSLSDGG